MTKNAYMIVQNAQDIGFIFYVGKLNSFDKLIVNNS